MENKEPMSFRDAVLCIIFFGLFCYFMLNGYYLFLAVFPAISAVMLCRDWENTVAKLKWTWTTFIVFTDGCCTCARTAVRMGVAVQYQQMGIVLLYIRVGITYC